METQLNAGTLQTIELVDNKLHYTFVDPMWEVVFGWSAEEVIGTHVRDIVALGVPKSKCMGLGGVPKTQFIGWVMFGGAENSMPGWAACELCS